MEPANRRALARYRPALRTVQVGALPALVVTPATLRHPGARILYLHGGAYTLFTARSTLFASVPLAHDLGIELWSIDYPRAPAARHEKTVPQVCEAVAAGCADGARVLLVGDSAGGGLALAVTLRLVAANAPRPAALALWSPWADLAASAEARGACAALDPVLDAADLERAAHAYAPAHSRGASDVSPLYGQYTPGFPPTLIQCGSRELLLADSAGVHHALTRAGARAQLEVNPGMLHSFPAILPGLPESRAARRRVGRFFTLLG